MCSLLINYWSKKIRKPNCLKEKKTAEEEKKVG